MCSVAFRFANGGCENSEQGRYSPPKEQDGIVSMVRWEGFSIPNQPAVGRCLTELRCSMSVGIDGSRIWLIEATNQSYQTEPINNSHHFRGRLPKEPKASCCYMARHKNMPGTHLLLSCFLLLLLVPVPLNFPFHFLVRCHLGWEGIHGSH